MRLEDKRIKVISLKVSEKEVKQFNKWKRQNNFNNNTAALRHLVLTTINDNGDVE